MQTAVQTPFTASGLGKVTTCCEHSKEFDIVLTVHRDKLYNRTKEMHVLSFIFDSIHYMFRIGKLFIIRRQCYMQRLVYIMHSYRLAVSS